MNICFICPEYPPEPHGGMGTFVQVTGRALVEAGHSVRVVGIYPRNFSAPEYEEDRGVKVWRLKMPSYPYGWVLARYRLYRLVKHWINVREVDVVDAHDPDGWFAGWPKLPVPLVVRAGGSFSYFLYDTGKPLDPNLFRLEKWSYHRADAWIAKSRYIGEITRKLFKLKTGPDAILYNPVNAPLSPPPFAHRDRTRVVFTGTLTPKKGIISLIDAWPAVLAEVPEAILDIYGKEGRAAHGEPMRQFLKNRLPAQAAASVRFHGHVSRDHLFDVLATARMAVFPSFSEGFAWAPLEAMANACPTIYTTLGSGEELISNGRDGLLADPNQPKQITAAILRILKNDEFARQLSEAGRARILEAFTLEKLLPLNEAFYQKVIHRFKQSGSRALLEVNPASPRARA